MHDQPPTPPASRSTRLVWIVLLMTASAVFSFAFACATPFAALATLAALTLNRRDAIGLIGLAWIADKAVGFGLPGYPHTASTYGWGAAIGAAALTALVAVARMPRVSAGGPVASALLGLAAAFCAYEAVLYGATVLLPGGDGAFAPAIVARLLGINAVALAGSALLHMVGAALGLIDRRAASLA